MVRKANPETDFTVSIDGLGDFRYGRRTLGDSMRIRSRFLQLVGDNADDIEMAATANAVAVHEVLCVSAPAGWEDLLKLDSVDPDNVSRVFELSAKLGDKEDSFRGAPKIHGEAAGSGAVQDAPVLVSA